MRKEQSKKAREDKGKLRAVGFQIPESTHRKLKIYAFKNGITLKELLTEAIEDLLEK
jgi:hypothetical protein